MSANLLHADVLLAADDTTGTIVSLFFERPLTARAAGAYRALQRCVELGPAPPNVWLRMSALYAAQSQPAAAAAAAMCGLAQPRSHSRSPLWAAAGTRQRTDLACRAAAAAALAGHPCPDADRALAAAAAVDVSASAGADRRGVFAGQPVLAVRRPPRPPPAYTHVTDGIAALLLLGPDVAAAAVAAASTPEEAAWRRRYMGAPLVAQRTGEGSDGSDAENDASRL
jgi:hypothetical protein